MRPTPGDAAEAVAVNVTAITAAEQPITRFIRVSGTLTPQEDAEVAAEIAGRVVATPVERGSAVRANDALIQIAVHRSRGAGARGAGQRRADRGAARP